MTIHWTWYWISNYTLNLSHHFISVLGFYLAFIGYWNLVDFIREVGIFEWLIKNYSINLMVSHDNTDESLFSWRLCLYCVLCILAGELYLWLYFAECTLYIYNNWSFWYVILYHTSYNTVIVILVLT